MSVALAASPGGVTVGRRNSRSWSWPCAEKRTRDRPIRSPPAALCGETRQEAAGRLSSAAERRGGGGGLRGQADRLGLDRVRGLGVFVEAAVLVSHQDIDRTVVPLVRAYHGVLEEGLDEQHLGILGPTPDDHGLLDLLD